MFFTNLPPCALGFYKLEPPSGHITIAELRTDENGIIRRFHFTDPIASEADPKNLAAAGWKFGPQIFLEDTLHEFKVAWGMYERAARAALTRAEKFTDMARAATMPGTDAHGCILTVIDQLKIIGGALWIKPTPEGNA